MKNLNNYIVEHLEYSTFPIIERLHINKDSKVFEDIDYDSANYVCYKLKEIKDIDNSIFDTQVTSFIHSGIPSWPMYVWEFDDRNKRQRDIFGEDIIKHRKFNNINIEQFNKVKPNTLASDNSTTIILRDKDYSEIYVISKNKSNKLYICLFRPLSSQLHF